MQGLTRNPLADPGLLGLTAGANSALALVMALSPSAGYLAITIACFIGATCWGSARLWDWCFKERWIFAITDRFGRSHGLGFFVRRC